MPPHHITHHIHVVISQFAGPALICWPCTSLFPTVFHSSFFQETFTASEDSLHILAAALLLQYVY